MLFKFIQKSFMNQKKAMALMIAAVAVGTAIASSLVSISIEIEGKVSKELRSFGANILIEPRIEGLADITGQKRYLRQQDIIKAKTIFWRHNILGVAPFLDTTASLKFNNRSEMVNVSGVWYEKRLPVPGEDKKFSAGIKNVFPWWHIQGSWPEGPGKVIAGKVIAERIGIENGTTLILNGKLFTVSGILETGGDEDDRILMDLEALQELKGHDGKVSRILISALTRPMDEFAYRDPEKMSRTEYEKWYCTGYVTSIAKQLEEVFAGSNAKPVWQVAGSEGRVLERLTLLIYILTFIVLIAAALGVSTTMIMSLLRRVEEIGLMKVIGADNRKIMIVFLSEGLIIGLLGGMLGYALSIAAAGYIGIMVFNTGFEQSIELFLMAIGSAVVISIGGTVIPVRKALKIQPGVVLKGAE